MIDLAARLALVRARIDEATRAAHRAAGSVRLVAVSKTKPVAEIRAAYAAGQRDFGENYVQELVAKANELTDLDDVRFHFIGHLQRNKAKLVARVARTVHTVDSPRLAVELAKHVASERVHGGAAAPSRIACLVEVNVGGESQKSGCAPSDLEALLSAIEAEPPLELGGLMTVPPYTENPADSRPFFDALAALRERHGGPRRLPDLSMGMTHDLEYAIAAGATIVRVGTAIFGGR